jgi:hypothetical protein
MKILQNQEDKHSICNTVKFISYSFLHGLLLNSEFIGGNFSRNVD